MKKTIVTILCGAQLATVPAAAAELTPEQGTRPTQMSTFGGARLRVPLGTAKEKAQAGLALTSTLRSGQTGELRFAKGAEFGVSGGDGPARLYVAGTPVSRLTQGGHRAEGRKLGVSALGWVGIAVGTVALLYGAAILICTPSSRCFGDDE